MSDPVGLLLVNKPSGVTSFDCVQLAKRRLGASKAGHCGTLDPAARGLMLLVIGAATRAQDSFLALEKKYWFRAQFGFKTSTGDREGEVVERRPSDQVTSDALKKVLQDFVGQIEQKPPMYSALKYRGKPYYHYARQGKEVPRVPRPVSIYSFELLSVQLPFWEARLACSRGTYVRTLAEDVAERCGSCATLLDLEREQIGPYRLDEAVAWDALRHGDAENLRSALRPVTLNVLPVHA